MNDRFVFLRRAHKLNQTKYLSPKGVKETEVLRHWEGYNEIV